MSSIVVEPLLTETGRISMVPCDPEYKIEWRHLKKQTSSAWTAEKVKFHEDQKNVGKVPVDELDSFKTVLGYFAGSDEIVEEMITKQFIPRIKIPEYQCIYKFECNMEKTHSETYNNNILAICQGDEKEKNRVLRGIETIKSVGLKASFARQWINSTKEIDYSIIGKAAVEGINFSSSFAFIDWLKWRNYRLDGSYLANAEISRDEDNHVTTGLLAHRRVVNKLSEGEVKDILDAAVDVELDFVNEVIPQCGYEGMTRELMAQHVEHAANVLATDLGYDIYSETQCPFKFMDGRSMNTKNNMFERDSGNYQKIDMDENNEDLEDAFREDEPI